MANEFYLPLLTLSLTSYFGYGLVVTPDQILTSIISDTATGWRVRKTLPPTSLRCALTNYLDITTPMSPATLKVLARFAEDKNEMEMLHKLAMVSRFCYFYSRTTCPVLIKRQNVNSMSNGVEDTIIKFSKTIFVKLPLKAAGTFIRKSFRLILGVISKKDCIVFPYMFYCHT